MSRPQTYEEVIEFLLALEKYYEDCQNEAWQECLEEIKLKGVRTDWFNRNLERYDYAGTREKDVCIIRSFLTGEGGCGMQDIWDSRNKESE